jgi:hypothetical protein
MTTTLGAALLLTAAAMLYKVVAFSAQRQAAEMAARQGSGATATSRATGACRCCWAR